MEILAVIFILHVMSDKAAFCEWSSALCTALPGKPQVLLFQQHLLLEDN